MTQPIKWVDNLKAICIFLVVFGHFSLNTDLKAIIYSVHLPAFLMITGYLLYPLLAQPSANYFFRKTLLYYLVLYVLFSLASIFLWYLLEARSLPISEIKKPLMGALLGVHGTSLSLIHNNDPLWYFPFLITSLIAAYVLMRLAILWRIIFFLAAVLLYSFYEIPAIFWSIDLAPLGALFVFVGVALRSYVEDHSRRIDNMQNLFLLSLVLFVWLILVWLNGSVNLNSRQWGASFVMFLMAAFCGMVFLIGVCQKMPASTIAHQLSRHTLIIFCTHIYLVKAINPFLLQLPSNIKDIAMLIAAAVICFLCFGLSWYVQPIITYWLKSGKHTPLFLRKGTR
jgi:fucose 4-O-acetylase-like acetyltransferase